MRIFISINPSFFDKQVLYSCQENSMNNKNECGCGRSPTGFCIGWHNLSETDYKAKLAIYEERQKNKKQQLIKT